MQPASTLPHPDDLEPIRQRAATEAFATRVGKGVLVLALYVNLVGSSVAALLGSSVGLAVAYGVVGVGLPAAGLIALSLWSRRRVTAALREVRALLGVQVRSDRLGWVALAGLAALGVGLSSWKDASFALGGVLIAIGPVAFVLRRRTLAGAPTWAIALLAGWPVVAGALILGLTPWLGDGALIVGGGFLLATPGGFVGRALRTPVSRLAERDDAWGRRARALSPLLPAADAARVVRRDQGASAAYEALVDQLARPLPQLAAGECLCEIGACLSDLGDARATEVLAAAARVLPADPRPFAGLARALAGSDRPLALAYAVFAEQNAARTLAGADAEITELRASLERSLSEETCSNAC